MLAKAGIKKRQKLPTLVLDCHCMPVFDCLSIQSLIQGQPPRFKYHKLYYAKIPSVARRTCELCIDNLLVRIQLIIEIILVDRPCAMGVFLNSETQHQVECLAAETTDEELAKASAPTPKP